MTDAKAKKLTLLILHKPYYAKIVDLSRFEFNIFKIVGERIYKFTLPMKDWLPIPPLSCDDVRARCERIERNEAARIIGCHFL